MNSPWLRRAALLVVVSLSFFSASFASADRRQAVPSLDRTRFTELLRGWGGEVTDLRILQGLALAASESPASAPTSGSERVKEEHRKVIFRGATTTPRWLVADLTGDGYQDLISARSGFVADGDKLIITALGGADGAVLWERRVSDMLGVWVVRDSDGDGAEDIVTVRVAPAELVSESPKRYTILQEISLISGRLGTTVWTRQELGQVEFTSSAKETEAGWFGGDIAYLRNFMGLFEIARTKSSESLFIDLFDIDLAGLSAGVTGHYIERVVESARMADVTTGRDRTSVSIWGLGYTYTGPTGDLDGDGYNEVIAWEYRNPVSGEAAGFAFQSGLSAYSGRDGVHLWSTESGILGESGIRYDPRQYAVPMTREAGSGADLVVVTDSPTTLSRISGTTGDVVWTSNRKDYLDLAYRGLPVTPIADLNDDGTTDLIQYFRVGECEGTFARFCVWESESARAVSGKDGNEIWSLPPENRTFVKSHSDFDGDGAQDLLSGTDVTTYGGRHRLDAFSTQTGALIWSGIEVMNLQIVSTLGGDLDGDGSEDLGTLRFVPERNATAADIHSGADSSTLWTYEHPLMTPWPGAFALDLVEASAGLEVFQPEVSGGRVLSSIGSVLWTKGF